MTSNFIIIVLGYNNGRLDALADICTAVHEYASNARGFWDTTTLSNSF